MKLPLSDALLASLSEAFPYIAIYESSHCQIDTYGEIETLIGIGGENAQTFTTWDALKKSQDGWKMGVLPYELKNVFEPQLTSIHLGDSTFPEVVFFVPSLVLIKYKGSSNWQVEGDTQLLDGISPIPSSPTPKVHFTANFSRSSYQETIHQLQQQIKAGDFYEINLAQQFSANIYLGSPFYIYRKLTRISPMPFCVFLKWQNHYIMSASPERYLRLDAAQNLISQPIKGTAKRGKTPQADARLRNNLYKSEKERAENIMIVDLVRNDLYRSCEINSVSVPHLFEIQTFPQVHQLVSTITGKKRADCSMYEAIERSFPPGSMTGAPKFRALERIDTHENAARGVYAGAAGYFTPMGTFDFNVIIRTLIYDKAKTSLSYHVGGAITYDSVAATEYDETLWKAQAIQTLFSPEE